MRRGILHGTDKGRLSLLGLFAAIEGNVGAEGIVLVEAGGIGGTGLGAVGFGCLNAEDSREESTEVILGNISTTALVKGFLTATGIEGKNGRSASQRFQMDSGEIFLSGGVQQQVCGGVDLCQILLVIGSVDRDDILGESLVDVLVSSHQNDLEAFI